MSEYDPSYQGGIVPNDPDQGLPTQDAAYYGPQAYGMEYAQMPPQQNAKPTFDSVESSKMTPQILVLLLLTGIKRNWKWALPVGLVLGAIAFGVLWFLFPIKYEAKAWIQILSAKPHFIFDEKQQRQYDNLVNTQFALIRSPLILEKALENPEVSRLRCVTREKNPAAWLAKELRLQTQGKSEMITIAFETEEATDAAKIVNSVVDAYFEYFDNQTQDWNSRLITQLTLELNRQQSAARRLQEEIRSNLEEAAKQGGGAGAEGGMAAGFAPGESIRRDVYLHESKLDALQAELKMLRESISEAPTRIPKSMLDNAIASDPLLNMLRSKRIDYQEQLKSLKEIIVREDDPRIQDLTDKIQKITDQINKNGAEMEDVKLSEIQRSMTASLEQQIWEKELAIRSQQILVDNLKNRYREQIRDAGDRTVKIVDVSFQQAQLQRINGVLDLLQTRVVSLQTELNAPAQIQLKKRADVPKAPKVQKRLPFATIGGLACCMIPLFLGVAIERMKPRLYHVSQIRRAIPNIIIGEIMEPPVSWVHGSSFRKRLARYRESVHSWCTHLLLSDPFRHCRTMSIASVSGDDGKTFLAVQIAVAMAQMRSNPVLLIDGDMRVGRLHLLFGNEESGDGLADVLSYRRGFGSAFTMNENEPNLHLLSAGHLDVSPYELLGDGQLRELFTSLEDKYSLILIVVPPVTHAAESLVMAACTDTVLLCVRQGETVLAAMEDVFRKLVDTGSSVDGIVVKDIPYYQMAGKDGGFADKLEQIRLSHLLQYSE